MEYLAPITNLVKLWPTDLAVPVSIYLSIYLSIEYLAPITQLVKRWPTDLAVPVSIYLSRRDGSYEHNIMMFLL